MLTTLTTLPARFLDCSAVDLHTILPGPTLIHLPGRREPPLFVVVLLHGNEDVGLRAVQTVLRRYTGRLLPRALSLFVGNVAAARHGLRRLDGQPDFNRVWPGTPEADAPEAAMMAQVVAAMRQRGAFASIDIHNNTGLNPHYACLTRLDSRFFHLAALFSRIAVYFTQPAGVQSAAFSDICPAVALECGKPGQPNGEAHAVQMVEAALHLHHFPDHAPAPHDLELYHTLAVVKVPQAASFSFSDPAADILFDVGLDHLNFRELPVGTPFGRVRDGLAPPLDVLGVGADAASRCFTVSNGELRTARPLIPAMLTLDERVIRQDCLCYLMERIPLTATPQGIAA